MLLALGTGVIVTVWFIYYWTKKKPKEEREQSPEDNNNEVKESRCATKDEHDFRSLKEGPRLRKMGNVTSEYPEESQETENKGDQHGDASISGSLHIPELYVQVQKCRQKIFILDDQLQDEGNRRIATEAKCGHLRKELEAQISSNKTTEDRYASLQKKFNELKCKYLQSLHRCVKLRELLQKHAPSVIATDSELLRDLEYKESLEDGSLSAEDLESEIQSQARPSLLEAVLPGGKIDELTKVEDVYVSEKQSSDREEEEDVLMAQDSEDEEDDNEEEEMDDLQEREMRYRTFEDPARIRISYLLPQDETEFELSKDIMEALVATACQDISGDTSGEGIPIDDDSLSDILAENIDQQEPEPEDYANEDDDNDLLSESKNEVSDEPINVKNTLSFWQHLATADPENPGPTTPSTTPDSEQNESFSADSEFERSSPFTALRERWDRNRSQSANSDDVSNHNDDVKTDIDQSESTIKDEDEKENHIEDTGERKERTASLDIESMKQHWENAFHEDENKNGGDIPALNDTSSDKIIADEEHSPNFKSLQSQWEAKLVAEEVET